MTTESKKRYDLFIIDGNTYDLTTFIPTHPGGPIWFAVANGRDLTAALYTYHKNPEA